MGAHEDSVARDREALDERRGRYGSGRMWLYLAFDPETGGLAIETSWLPDDEAVRRVLRPLGFRRGRDGSYRLALDAEAARDTVGVVRVATRALAIMLEEA